MKTAVFFRNTDSTNSSCLNAQTRNAVVYRNSEFNVNNYPSLEKKLTHQLEGRDEEPLE